MLVERFEHGVAEAVSCGAMEKPLSGVSMRSRARSGDPVTLHFDIRFKILSENITALLVPKFPQGMPFCRERFKLGHNGKAIPLTNSGITLILDGSKPNRLRRYGAIIGEALVSRRQAFMI